METCVFVQNQTPCVLNIIADSMNWSDHTFFNFRATRLLGAFPQHQQMRVGAATAAGWVVCPVISKWINHSNEIKRARKNATRETMWPDLYIPLENSISKRSNGSLKCFNFPLWRLIVSRFAAAIIFYARIQNSGARGAGIRGGDCSSSNPAEIIKWNATQIAGGRCEKGLKEDEASTNYEMPAPTLGSLRCDINFWRRVPLSPKIVQSNLETII